MKTRFSEGWSDIRPELRRWLDMAVEMEKREKIRWIGPHMDDFEEHYNKLKLGDIIRISGESWDFISHTDDGVKTDFMEIKKKSIVAIGIR